MKIRLVAIDMDGTYLDDQCKIPKRNLQAVLKAIAKGVLIVPTTGRSFRNVKKELFHDVPGIAYSINANGSVVADMKQEQLLHSEIIPKEIVDQIYHLVKQYPAFMELYGGLEAYVDTRGIDYLYQSGMDPAYCDQLMRTNIVADDLDQVVLEKETPISKFHIVCPTPVIKDELKAKIAKLQGVYPISVTNKNIEIVSGTYSKRDGLGYLINYLGIEKDQVLVIGDSNNDYEMIEWAHHSVAMKNANDRIKALAKHITLSNNEAGVAAALERYLELPTE